MIGEYSGSDSDFEWDDLDNGYLTEEVYPVQTQRINKEKRTTPYGTRPKKPSKTIEIRQDDRMEETFDQVESESQKELELIKLTYNPVEDFNLYEEIKDIKIPIAFRKLVKISPKAKTQLMKGMSKPQGKAVETEIATLIAEEEPKRTSAYMRSYIGGEEASTIADTGAGCSIIGQAFLRRINWPIEKPATTTLIVADGQKAVPLGSISNVPVTLANGVTIIVKWMIVCNGEYDALLGNDVLHAIHAILDMNAEKMEIEHRGKKHLINLTTTKGTQPPFKTAEQPEGPYESDSDHEEARVIQEESPSILTQEWHEGEEYQRTETPQWDVEDDWNPQVHYDMGWPKKNLNEWGGHNDLDWESVPTPAYTFVPMVDNTPASARTIRWQKNFEIGYCIHHVPFYSPSTECWQCDNEVNREEAAKAKAVEESNQPRPDSPTTSEDSTSSRWSDMLMEPPIDFNTEKPPTFHKQETDYHTFFDEMDQGNQPQKDHVEEHYRDWLRELADDDRQQAQWIQEQEAIEERRKARDKKRWDANVRKAAQEWPPRDTEESSYLTKGRSRCPIDPRQNHYVGWRCHTCDYMKKVPEMIRPTQPKRPMPAEPNWPTNRDHWRTYQTQQFKKPDQLQQSQTHWCPFRRIWVDPRQLCQRCTATQQPLQKNPTPSKDKINPDFWKVGAIDKQKLKLTDEEQVLYVSRIPRKPKLLAHPLPRIE